MPLHNPARADRARRAQAKKRGPERRNAAFEKVARFAYNFVTDAFPSFDKMHRLDLRMRDATTYHLGFEAGDFAGNVVVRLADSGHWVIDRGLFIDLDKVKVYDLSN